jgi:hypothetical protein
MDIKTETWLISSAKSHFSLMEKTLLVVRYFGKPDSLLIVDYAGHGSMNASRQASGAGEFKVEFQRSNIHN